MKHGVLSLVALLMLQSTPGLPARGNPVQIWRVSHEGSSIYYGGGVKDGLFYTGQISWGPQVWDNTGERANGMDLRAEAPIGCKCSTAVGDHVFFTHAEGGGVYRIDIDWATNSLVQPVNPDDIGPEALATDGTYLYTNDDANRGCVHKYEIDNNEEGFTLTEVWCSTTSLSRIRGISYHNGSIYAVDSAGTEVVEIDTESGVASVLFNLPETAKVYYQAVRSGNRIFVVGNDSKLRVYEKDGTTWSEVGAYDILTAGYGISDVADGCVWITTSRQISLWSLRELPFTDNFESYPENFPIDDLAYNGWSAKGPATIVAGAGAENGQAAGLSGDSSIKNAISPAATMSRAWTDMSVMAVRYNGYPQVDESAGLMLFVNEDGYVAVRDPALDNWLICSNNVIGEAVAPIADDTYARITLFQDYDNGCVSIFANNELLRERIAMNGNRTHYESFELRNVGENVAYLDKISVSEEFPLDMDGDVDGDGWSDARELATFGSIFAATNGVPMVWLADRGLSDPDGDEDGDNMTNAEEYLAGTDPNDDASTFRILGIKQDGDTTALIIMGNDSGSPAPYVIERSTNLVSGFESYDEAPRGPAPGNTVYTDATPADGTIFYRIKATE